VRTTWLRTLGRVLSERQQCANSCHSRRVADGSNRPEGDLPAWCWVRKECERERSFRRTGRRALGICANPLEAVGVRIERDPKACGDPGCTMLSVTSDRSSNLDAGAVAGTGRVRQKAAVALRAGCAGSGRSLMVDQSSLGRAFGHNINVDRATGLLAAGARLSRHAM